MDNLLQVDQPLTDEWVERYLTYLKVDRETPSYAALRRLTRAHVRNVLFENGSALIRRDRNPSGPVPPLDSNAILRGWESGESGGVCFEIASQFYRLLRALGYDARPILAQISFPGSHHAIVVHLGNDRHLVDIGCGSPLFEPIPLDRTTEWTHPGLAFRFRADHESPDVWVQDRWIGEKWEQFCRYELQTAVERDRYSAYQQHHEPGVSWVTGTLTIIRNDDENLYQIRDDLFMHFSAAGKTSTIISSRPELADILSRVFCRPDFPFDAALAARDRIKERFES